MDAIRALEIVRGEFENIHVVVFSIYPKMEYIPDWMDYKFNPTQKEIVEIYNNSSIFISSSHTEGFGLPVAEAMACGCCTVVTDIPAYRDFTIENITSLYFPVGDYLMMARKIINLLEHDLSRQNMGKRGADFIREKLSLNKSIELFSSIFEDERQ
jgi:glycosyltransferase involved in cell wall biosynthesis